MRDLTPWAFDEIDEVRAYIANPTITIPELARRLGRTKASVQFKIAWLRGSKWATRSTRPGYEPGQRFTANFDSPQRRANDCRKHLTKILEAHGAGFPVCGGGR